MTHHWKAVPTERTEPVTGARLIAAATGIMGVLKGEGYTSSEALAIFELALRIGREAAPRLAAADATRMVDRVMIKAGLPVPE